MEWSIPFIGRDNELASIRSHLEAQQTRRIVFLQGEGGIGKTRLLHEIERRFPSSETLKILSVVDFDDDQYKFPQNVGVTIGRQLDPTAFDQYLEALRKMRALEVEGNRESEISAHIRRQTLTVNRCFVECFNEVSQKKRIVLRIDTTDALRDAILVDYLYELISKLSNVVVLIAGRDAKQWFKKYHKDMGDEEILLMPLQPFTLKNSRAYLEEKQRLLKVTLEQEWMDKLFILASGLPVLIDLAIEWGRNHRPLELFENYALTYLQDLQQQQTSDENARQALLALQEEFKKTVIMPTAESHSHFDHLKLVLAKVYPLDLE